jgi:hypothetical protein
VLGHKESRIVHQHWWRLKKTITLQVGRKVASRAEGQNYDNCARVCLKTSPDLICNVNY